MADTEHEAHLRLAELIDTLGVETEPETPRVGNLVEGFIESRVDRVRPATISHYRHAAQLLEPLFEVFGDKLTVRAIEDRLTEVAKEGRVSKGYLLRARWILRKSYQWGGRHGLVPADLNPALLAEMPADRLFGGNPRPPRALTTDEIVRLISTASNHRLGASLVVALSLGLRPAEVRALQWTDIDLDRATLQVSHTIGKGEDGEPVLREPKTQKSRRKLRLVPFVVDVMREHQKFQAEEVEIAEGFWPEEWDGHVFRSINGKPVDPSNFRKLWSRIADEAGVSGSVAPKDARTTVASQLIVAGIADYQVQDLLGHVDLTMLHRVYRQQIEDVVEAVLDPETLGLR